jgi:O-antigen ligase
MAGTSTASSALPRGLRIRRRRRPVWLVVVAIAGAGVMLGGVLTQASTTELLGALVVLLAMATSFYRPSVSLALLAFTYPFDLRTFAGPVKLTTSAALMAIIVLTWVIRQVLPYPPALRRTPLDVAVLIFVGATVLSLAGLGGHLQDQAVALLKAAGGFLIFFIATQSLKTREDVWLVLGAMLASGVAQAVSLCLPVLNGTLVITEATRATGGLSSPNLFSGYLILIIPLAIAIGVSIRGWWGVLPTAAVTMVLIVALVATFSRSGWLGLLTATILLVILLARQRWRVLAVTGFIAAILLVAGLSTSIGARFIGNDQTGTSISMLASRWEVWTAAVSMFAHHPLGVGIDNFYWYYAEFSGRTDQLNHAHNLLLNMLAERGFLGFVTFIFFLGLLFRTAGLAFRGASSLLERALAAAVIATFAGYLVHSIFEVSYYDYKVLLLFWLLAGTAAVLPAVLRRTEFAAAEEGTVPPALRPLRLRPGNRWPAGAGQ